MAISVNKATLVGRVGGDVKTAGRDNQIVRFSLATSERWKNKTTGDYDERTQWHNIVIFNEHKAKFAREYVKKGDLVYVEGQIETREYEADGETKRVTEIVLRPYSGELQLQSKQRDEGGESSRSYGSKPSTSSKAAFELEDDIPF